MPWQVAVVVRILAAYVAGPLLLKPIVDKYSQAKLLLLQFAVCFAVALPLAVALNQHHLDWTIVAVGGERLGGILLSESHRPQLEPHGALCVLG